MRAKIVHDDINSGGGSERLAVVTMDLLGEMGFKIDLASFNMPDFEELKRDFGDVVNSIDIRPVKLDFFSMIGLDNRDSAKIPKSGVKAYENDNEYALIVNTHADLLPYFDQTFKSSKKRVITYCHFPLVPKLVQNNDGNYLRRIRKWTNMENFEEDFKQQVLKGVAKTYDMMMKNTTVLTNSRFSKRAIEEHYGQAINPTVVYPPVDVSKFRDIAQSNKRENAILVISRFSPDKQLENVIEICKMLVKDVKISAKMILVGNIAASDKNYVENLRQSIHDYGLDDRISIEVDVSFDRLLDLMGRSKIYLHPLLGEPFGISIVEAMSAGLIPVVPNVGGYTEFVPDYYQFSNHKQAADVIGKIFIASDNDMQAERSQLSKSVSKFSNEIYKTELGRVIEQLQSSRESEAV
jgi:glycosyltransferase involved in cell wall biosynthesis